MKHLHISRQWLYGGLVVALVAMIFLATTDNAAIWPLRNIVAYRLSRWWHANYPVVPPSGYSSLHGCVYTAQHDPVAAATVILAERDGMFHRTSTDADGCYTMTDVPPGRYVPLADAPGYDAVAVRPWGLPVQMQADVAYHQDIALPAVSLPLLQPGRDLRLSSPVTVTGSIPRPGVAVRRQLTYTSGTRPNQLTFLYTPITTTGNLPTLLAIYPGQADWWQDVSVSLADAGYAIIATGPAYALDLEQDIDELQRLIAFTRAGKLPGTDGGRIAVLGGSYSSLHLHRLLQRDTGLRSAIVLGGASDLFDLRRRFEQGSFFPPLGLDQALIALGTPNTSPERYWRYSARFHLRGDMPPIAVLHSRDDDIVPAVQSELLIAELERLDMPHEAYFFDGMAHYFLSDPNTPELLELYMITLDFLERTLGD